MSAYMVDKIHIDIMVQLALDGPKAELAVRPDNAWHPFYYFDYTTERSKAVQFEEADALGQMLVAENLRSIHARYPDTIGHDEYAPGPSVSYWSQPYHFDRPRYIPTAVEALKGLSCYEYQSCESDEWRTSEAKGFCDSLRSHLISRLPGYNEAAWSWKVARS